jgi:hypothetical protein
VIAAALGCLLVLAAPGGAGAAPRAGQGDGRSNGFSHSEARQVLHHARSLLKGDEEPTDDRQASTDLTMALRDLYLARPALTGADRRSADRLLSRSYAAPKAQAASVGGVTTTCSTHFCVHYASPTTSSWAATTLTTLEHVWSVEVPMMHRQPLPDNGTAGDPDNPDNRLDVYLQDLGSQGYYGYCTADENASGRQVPAYCALDDDFARSQYGATPVNSLRVTAAHEFFHAIQFAADVTESTWFMEGSATWAEDVVYNSINDNYQYLPSSPIRHPSVPLDYAGGTYPYGSFVFFKYASQRRGNDVVRRFWDAAVGTTPALQAIRNVVGTSAWPAYFTLFASWNTLPLHSYLERAGYLPPTWWHRKTLAGAHSGTGQLSVRIKHLAAASVQLTPGAHLSPRKHLLVTIDAPATSTGARALLQRRFKDGRVAQTMIPLTAAGDRHLSVAFNHKLLRSVAIVLADTATSGGGRLFKVKATVH